MKKKSKQAASGPTPAYQMRISLEDRELFQRAATKLGLSVSAFIRMSAKEKAERVLK